MHTIQEAGQFSSVNIELLDFINFVPSHYFSVHCSALLLNFVVLNCVGNNLVQINCFESDNLIAQLRVT